MNYGSGTDPIEGSALAISILEHFHIIGATTICTTHYDELKKFVIETDGFENASCEFNIELLKPTYRLLLGIPGSSNAFAISKRLGLSQELIDKAQKRVDYNSTNVENILNKLQNDKITIEKEKEFVLKESENIKKLKENLENQTSYLEHKKQEILENAKIKAREILIDAKNEADTIIKNMNKLSKGNSFKELENNRSVLKNKLNEISKDLILPENKPTNKVDLSKIKKGLEIYLPSIGKNAIILSLPDKDNNINVQSGVMKFKVNINDIELLKNKKTSTTSQKVSMSSMEISNEINFLGYTVDEALPILDKYLDNAYLAKLSSVRIVHGKGTGALKNGVHNFLRNHPHVKSFRLGTFGEGEMGVTIAQIK